MIGSNSFNAFESPAFGRLVDLWLEVNRLISTITQQSAHPSAKLTEILLTASQSNEHHMSSTSLFISNIVFFQLSVFLWRQPKMPHVCNGPIGEFLSPSASQKIFGLRQAEKYDLPEYISVYPPHKHNMLLHSYVA